MKAVFPHPSSAFPPVPTPLGPAMPNDVEHVGPMFPLFPLLREKGYIHIAISIASRSAIVPDPAEENLSPSRILFRKSGNSGNKDAFGAIF